MYMRQCSDLHNELSQRLGDRAQNVAVADGHALLDVETGHQTTGRVIQIACHTSVSITHWSTAHINCMLDASAARLRHCLEYRHHVYSLATWDVTQRGCHMTARKKKQQVLNVLLWRNKWIILLTTHTQPFYGPFSRTSRVSRCQKRTSGLYGARED